MGRKTGPRSGGSGSGSSGSSHQALICICECRLASCKSGAGGERERVIGSWRWRGRGQTPPTCWDSTVPSLSSSTCRLASLSSPRPASFLMSPSRLPPSLFSSLWGEGGHLEDNKGLIESSGLSLATASRISLAYTTRLTVSGVIFFLLLRLLDTMQPSYDKQRFRRDIELRKKIIKKNFPKHKRLQPAAPFAQPLKRGPVLH